jgi:hypothetical protein
VKLGKALHACDTAFLLTLAGLRLGSIKSEPRESSAGLRCFGPCATGCSANR